MLQRFADQEYLALVRHVITGQHAKERGLRGPFGPTNASGDAAHDTDHADHSLEIVRVLGGRPDATAVQLTAIDPAGATFTAEVAEGNRVGVVVPWSEEITERPQFRSEFARMFREAAQRTRELSEAGA